MRFKDLGLRTIKTDFPSNPVIGDTVIVQHPNLVLITYVYNGQWIPIDGNNEKKEKRRESINLMKFEKYYDGQV